MRNSMIGTARNKTVAADLFRLAVVAAIILWALTANPTANAQTGDQAETSQTGGAMDSGYAAGWWNTLSPEQMVAALHGDQATEEQATAAKKLYADLDPETKKLVNDAATLIYGEGGHDSVGAWWETLNCQLMRIAAGDGATPDPQSPFCAHYPGSGAAKLLDADALAHVNKVGQGLLGQDNPGAYPDLDTWKVRGGDTLWDIAVKIYGDGQKWRYIWSQNRYRTMDDRGRVFTDYRLIFPGWTLYLPEG